ncbi:NUDIX hydrolase [uncultured Castellaniella sp.]|uniref:NUDIX hydrolase n=1 Tax=uncultured Castellaniella sp. TaxID=647907 RepID=UPI0026131470|nr:NUDIX hydrolase [uncultured Castellaniella sp.]
MNPSDPAFYHPAPRTQQYCSQCGHALTRDIPPDDNRIRDLCTHCGAVHYQNPRNVVGVVPILGDQVLLCRRAIEPRHGKWTLPAGFMELGETTEQGAARENQEESGARIRIESLYTVIDVPSVNQVHLFYLAQALDAHLAPGPETLEAAFFDLDRIPWHDLAFRTVSTTLEHYLKDREQGRFPTRHYAIDLRFPD